MSGAAGDAVARRKAAVLGGIVADAATMGLHWIYDGSKITDLLKSKGREAQPEFFEPPSCPFYEMPSGALTPYGAELAALLTYANARGPAGVSGATWAPALAKYFTSTYQGYRNKSVKTLIANLEAGKAYPATGDGADTQADMICKVPAVVARYAGSPELPSAVEAAVRAQQSSDLAVQYGLGAARILERVVLGHGVAEAIEWARSAPDVPEPVRDAASKASDAAASPEPLGAIAARFGLSCGMPGALINSLVAASRAEGYEAGLRANIVAGGDNASRACYLGALLAAAYGGPPAVWAERVTGYAAFEGAAERVATM